MAPFDAGNHIFSLQNAVSLRFAFSINICNKSILDITMQIEMPIMLSLQCIFRKNSKFHFGTGFV